MKPDQVFVVYQSGEIYGCFPDEWRAQDLVSDIEEDRRHEFTIVKYSLAEEVELCKW